MYEEVKKSQLARILLLYMHRHRANPLRYHHLHEGPSSPCGPITVVLRGGQEMRLSKAALRENFAVRLAKVVLREG